jgi:hypothetical protein
MKRSYGSSFAIAFLIVAIVSGVAFSQGFGPHRPHGGIVPMIVGRMVGRQKVHSVIAADKANLKNLHSQLRAAHLQLVKDLVAGNDTTSDVAALETARNNLLAEKVKLAKTILANLSKSQRAQVSHFLTEWNSMRESQRQERMKLLQGLAGAKSAKQ